MSSNFEVITYRNDLSHYLINRKGEIYSLNSHTVIKPQIDRSGYLTMVLTTDDGKRIKFVPHIAVAKQYIPNSDKAKIYVNHIDENKQNPSVDNLEWVTPKENTNHGTAVRRSSDHRQKPVNEYDLDGKYIRTWASTRKMIEFFASFFGKTVNEMRSCENSINGCLRGRSKTSMNRVWRYYDGNKKNIKVEKNKYMPMGIACSHSKMRFDIDIDVPDEYLYHKMLKKDIYNYFMELDKLTEYEKQMLADLFSDFGG